ncbi:MAG: hypothetical protein K8W52_45080 [Deltaproteobacteria bacterium]|nr:hypothetical protein [Deltaproteobacteria bacterium]
MPTVRSSLARTRSREPRGGSRWAAAALFAIGCGTSGGTPDEELPGLVHAPVDVAPTIDVARAGKDAAVLTSALTMPERYVTKALGAHTLTAKSSVTISDGATQVEQLTDEVTLEVDASGAFHATENNNADYGREVIYTGGKLFLRPRYARWHGRAPEDDAELTKLKDDLGSTLAAHVELVSSAISVADRGAVEQAGRPGHRVAIDRMQAPAPAPAQTLKQRAWRTDSTVNALAGDVILDEKTGVPLHAHLEATVEFARDGHRYTMAIVVDHDVTAIGAPHPVSPPPADQVVATPERLHEVDERDTLLDGMAPPARKKAAAPAPVDPAPAPPTGTKAAP